MRINEEWPWKRRNFRNVLNWQVTIYTACKFHKNMRAYLYIISDTFYYGLYSYVLLVMDCHGTPQVSLASSDVAAVCCCTVLLLLALLLHYTTYNKLYVYRTRICVLHENSYCCSINTCNDLFDYLLHVTPSGAKTSVASLVMRRNMVKGWKLWA